MGWGWGCAGLGWVCYTARYRLLFRTSCRWCDCYCCRRNLQWICLEAAATVKQLRSLQKRPTTTTSRSPGASSHPPRTPNLVSLVVSAAQHKLSINAQQCYKCLRTPACPSPLHTRAASSSAAVSSSFSGLLISIAVSSSSFRLPHPQLLSFSISGLLISIAVSSSSSVGCSSLGG